MSSVTSATPTVPSAQTRRLPARDARGRFMARAGAVPRASRTPRVRTLPARDSRGRFVSFPTTQAPSWYVFCAGHYRIPEAPAAPLPAVVLPAPQAAPRPTVRTPRRRWTRSDVQSTLLMLLVLVVTFWYGLQLPVPHR
jgi:hypothetical protein